MILIIGAVIAAIAIFAIKTKRSNKRLGFPASRKRTGKATQKKGRKEQWKK
jgi:hypothetical protein